MFPNSMTMSYNLISLFFSSASCTLSGCECVFKRVVCSLMGPVFLMSTKLLPFAHSHIRSPSLLLYHPSLSPSPSLHHLNSTSPLHFFLFCSLITLVLSRCISMGVGWQLKSFYTSLLLCCTNNSRCSNL